MLRQLAETMRKILTILEVIAVLAGALAAVGLVARSPFASWQRTHLLRPFAEYLALGLVPALAIALARRPWSDFGVRTRGFSGQLDASLRCLLPFAVAKALVFVLGPRQTLHSVIEPIVAVAVIAYCARTLRQGSGAPPTGLPLLFFILPMFSPLKAASALLFYPFFLAPAEELLFRGYIQSRLNQALGRPFQAAGAVFGPGLPLSAALFSLFHVLNLPALFAGHVDLQWATALPTLAWGLAFGYLRERTDSLLPSTIAHGVPQAIAWVVLGR